MPIVQPPKERHSIEDNGLSLRIIVPSRRNYLAMLFMGFWLIFWAFGELAVLGVVLGGIVQVLFKTPNALSEIDTGGLAGLLGGGLFMLVWLTGWTVGGGFVLYTFLWQLSGKENIEINNETIKIQNAVFGFGRVNEYSETYIKDLRVMPSLVDNNIFGWSRPTNFWGRPNGLLAFDYGSKTFRFGGGIDEAEAKQILEKIISRFPQNRGRKSETD